MQSSSLKIKLWVAGSIISAWQFLTLPRFHWTQYAVWFGLISIIGTIFCIFLLDSLLRIRHEKNNPTKTIESLGVMALVIYVPVYFLSQYPAQVMEPRYVALDLGKWKQSRVYRIGSEPSKIVEPPRKDDWYRKLHYFRFWQTAAVEGFTPSRRDIPEAKNASFVGNLIVAVIERAIGNFRSWILVSVGLGIFFLIQHYADKRQDTLEKKKKTFSF
jgi:hypothetical protein